MLDAVSLMPKRSSNNTGANLYKSDTTVKRKLVPRYFPTIDTLFLYDFHFLCVPQIFREMIPYHHVYSIQQQMTRQKSLV
jgi:hypothetical protein